MGQEKRCKIEEIVLILSEFCHNHHPTGEKMWQNLFDVDFRLYSSFSSGCFRKESIIVGLITMVRRPAAVLGSEKTRLPFGLR